MSATRHQRRNTWLFFYLFIAAMVWAALPQTTLAQWQPKRTLAGHMNITYQRLPGPATNLSEILGKGMVYGRLRSNFFYWDWEDETANQKDHRALGLGHSMIAKSAPYRGLSGTLGLYTSYSGTTHMQRDDIAAGLLKSGKDVLSRDEIKRGGDDWLAVLGQAYLEFAAEDTKIVAGRQLFHSVLTKSNDTKMVPNTFDGVSMTTKALPDTQFQAAYFVAQKLRDHTTAHDVITFRDASGNPWGNQDDAGVHKGLTYDRFQAAGKRTDHALVVATLANQSFKNLTTSANLYSVPEVLLNVSMEMESRIPLGSWSLQPAFRYMRQFDSGGGAIGGASLSGNVSDANPGGYRHPNRLDADLLAVRAAIAAPKGVARLMFGFSQVFDKADLVTPWRGFPTGGYTRAMAQYNWNANTNSYMAELKLDLGKANLVSGLTSLIRYAFMDFDEKKTLTDRSIVHIDLIQHLPSLRDLYLKVRTGLIEDDGATSYNEYRTELNYLF